MENKNGFLLAGIARDADMCGLMSIESYVIFKTNTKEKPAVKN